MDGNNSVKRLLSAGQADDRPFDSDYFISREEVDKFKDEAKSRKPANDNVNAPWAPEGEPEDVFDDNGRPAPCADSWKASAAEYNNKKSVVYNTTGMFASACRHGMITKVCEMVQSGEQRKYSLAVLQRLMETYGKDLAVGFDIGCSMQATVRDSVLVGPVVRENRLSLLVNAFHGWAHNRQCQVHNHPLYAEGVGIEDMETMERLFSSSNSVAAGIQMVSHYHWKQALDLFFQQWDEDKYLELGHFLYNNLRQALAIIAEYTPIVEAFKIRMNLQDGCFEIWLGEERIFFANLEEEPEEKILEVSYVEALIANASAEKEWSNHNVTFVQEPSQLSGSEKAAAKQRVSSHVAKDRAVSKHYEATLKNVEKYHQSLGLEEDWTPESEDYIRVLRYIETRNLRRAMDRVQFLVVQRLLEFEKAHSSGLGYKLRMKISKLMRTREDAIRKAIKAYNELAAKMNPPAPQLHKDDVFGYTFLGEFDFLKYSYSRADITEKPWSNPTNRQVASKYFKIKRTHEEIQRINVEVRRLQTWIRDENIHLKRKVDELQRTDPMLVREAETYRQHRLRLNSVQLVWIQAIQNTPGFSGSLYPGTRVGPTHSSETATATADNTGAGPVSDNDQSILPSGSEIPQNPENAATLLASASIPQEDLALLQDEINIGRTQDDLVADEERNEQVAGLVNLMHKNEMVPPPVKSRSRRLRDVVPNNMMSVLCFR